MTPIRIQFVLLAALATLPWGLPPAAQEPAGEPGGVPSIEQEAEPEAVENVLRAPASRAPLVERYILDELRTLRAELAQARVEMIREITDRELKVAENVSGVANNTVTFFFYLLAGLSAAFGIWGWQSIRDLRSSVRTSAESEIARLSEEYETRLTRLEKELQSKGSIILENQREIERTQMVQALWLQANQSSDPRSKVEVYDRILELMPGDPETMTYKADAALELGESDWALSLCNRILEDNPDNALALYQRACARVGIGEVELAMVDLARAASLMPALRERAREQPELAPLLERDDFKDMLEGGGETPKSKTWLSDPP